MNSMRVAVVGATGAVGREMLRILDERDFPLDDLVPLASTRSEGMKLEFHGEKVTVRSLADRWFEGVDLALTTAGSVIAREVVPAAAAAGTVCIDNSSAFRMDPDVPLVVPEINPDALRGHRNVIANGNCTAITALMPLGPLHRAFSLRFLVTSSYQSVSGTGMKGVRELAEQVEKLHGQEESLGHPDRGALPVGVVFGRPIAFNVVPLCESPDPLGSGFTSEELKMGDEVRKVLGTPDLQAHATAVRVPVVAGHSVSMYARFDRPITAAGAREVLASAPGVRLVDVPTPLEASGIDDVLVGRIRQPDGDDRAVMLFACGDNLRKGAALNAVQIAELVIGG
jgi:aspartate-semialdehyde dehydrogenase